MKRLGRYTLLFEHRPAILGHAAVCGKKEAAGPLARDFDQTFLDSYLNQESWEKRKACCKQKPRTLRYARRGFKSRTLTWYLREIC